MREDTEIAVVVVNPNTVAKRFATVFTAEARLLIRQHGGVPPPTEAPPAVCSLASSTSTWPEWATARGEGPRGELAGARPKTRAASADGPARRGRGQRVLR